MARDIKRISWDIMGYVDIMVVDMIGEYRGDQPSNWIYPRIHPRIYPIYPIVYPEVSSVTLTYQIVQISSIAAAMGHKEVIWNGLISKASRSIKATPLL